jgi:hypothetical protein
MIAGTLAILDEPADERLEDYHDTNKAPSCSSTIIEPAPGENLKARSGEVA